MNFLSQIAGISSVKYRRCPGRRFLLVDYSSGVPLHSGNCMHGLCAVYTVLSIRPPKRHSMENSSIIRLTSDQNSLVSSSHRPSLAIISYSIISGESVARVTRYSKNCYAENQYVEFLTCLSHQLWATIKLSICSIESSMGSVILPA